jgi:hypothetical protein
MISAIFFIIITILVIYLIVNRVNQVDKEKFDKRKN